MSITFIGETPRWVGSLPVFSIYPSRLSIAASSASSDGTSVTGTYSIAQGTTPTGGLITLNTSSGVSNDIDFLIGYPDATITSVDPSTWQAGGGPFAVTITGNNFGTNPTVNIGPSDITYSFGPPQNGTITGTVTVPASEAFGVATIAVSPGNTGCIGSCYTSSDPGNPSGQASTQIPITSPTYSLNPATLKLSTGDTSKTITVTSSTPPVPQVTYSSHISSNNASSCPVTLTTPGQSASTTVTASPPNCSGIFTVFVAALFSNATSTVVVPPQQLIQVLYGEADVTVSYVGTTTAQVLMEALGNTIGNRYLDPHFSPNNSWQAIIATPGQFDGYPNGQSQTTGVEPELDAAANVFAKSAPIASVQNAMCFFSPGSAGWSSIQAAQAANAITVPAVAHDPGCFTQSTSNSSSRTAPGPIRAARRSSYSCKRRLPPIRLS